jgi:hypothetical protein
VGGGFAEVNERGCTLGRLNREIRIAEVQLQAEGS